MLREWLKARGIQWSLVQQYDKVIEMYELFNAGAPANVVSLR